MRIAHLALGRKCIAYRLIAIDRHAGNVVVLALAVVAVPGAWARCTAEAQPASQRCTRPATAELPASCEIEFSAGFHELLRDDVARARQEWAKGEHVSVIAAAGGAESAYRVLVMIHLPPWVAAAEEK